MADEERRRKRCAGSEQAEAVDGQPVRKKVWMYAALGCDPPIADTV